MLLRGQLELRGCDSLPLPLLWLLLWLFDAIPLSHSSARSRDINKVVDEAKTDENLRIELSDELEQLKMDQKNLVVIFAARGPEEGATPLAQVCSCLLYKT